MAGLQYQSLVGEFDIPKFDVELLADSSSKYKKVSKRSGRWLVSEFDLPLCLLEPIASSMDYSVCSLARPHQILLNLHPELGMEGGGFRTIAKTPKVYRIWARTRTSRKFVSEWEPTLRKPYDKAGKGSSALIAVANRSLAAEIATDNCKKVCGFLFDRKFFDKVSACRCLYRVSNAY